MPLPSSSASTAAFAMIPGTKCRSISGLSCRMLVCQACLVSRRINIVWARRGQTSLRNAVSKLFSVLGHNSSGRGHLLALYIAVITVILLSSHVLSLPNCSAKLSTRDDLDLGKTYTMHHKLCTSAFLPQFRPNFTGVKVKTIESISSSLMIFAAVSTFVLCCMTTAVT